MDDDVVDEYPTDDLNQLKKYVADQDKLVQKALSSIKESIDMNNVVEKILAGADIRKSIFEGVNDGDLNIGESVLRESTNKTLKDVLSTLSDWDKIIIKDKTGFVFFEGYKKGIEKPVQQRVLKKYFDQEVVDVDVYKETTIIKIDVMSSEKDLKESGMEIKLKGPQRDNWTEFEIELDGKFYDCQMKHFEKGSEWGIDGGKISKLWVKDIETGDVIIHYDRGWDIKPNSQAAKEIYDSIIDAHN